MRNILVDLYNPSPTARIYKRGTDYASRISAALSFLMRYCLP